jgi:hypothetical protein
VGLALEVGMLADLLVHDEEGANWFREDLAKLNGLLATAGLPPHTEPTEAAVHSTDMYGYSGLHYLRRCAAHLHYRGQLPLPLKENESPTDDELLVRYGAEFVAENEDATPGSLAAPSARPFDHLIMHSDAEGFYIPQALDRVLISGEESYGWVGSCQALRSECERLATALELPGDLLNDSDSDALVEAIEKDRRGKAGGWQLFKPKADATPAWRAHPIAALICAKLYCFTGHSIQTNAVLVFC